VNAISHEHERGTFELLLATPLSASQVLAGKLVAALAFLLLLLTAAAPIFTLVLLFGGVSSADITRVLATLLATAVAGCCFGICCSAITRQTYSATLLCYALLISLVGGTLFAANVWSLVNGLAPAPPALVVANPLSAMAAALAPVRPPEASFTGGLRPLALLSLLSRGVISGGQAAPLHRATIILYGAAAIVLFWLALHAVRPRQRWRVRREDGLLLLALLAYTLLAYLVRGWWLIGLVGAA
jgi:ABC-type transport system involved in multi-copper enzyme maturation permease subunit